MTDVFFHHMLWRKLLTRSIFNILKNATRILKSKRIQWILNIPQEEELKTDKIIIESLRQWRSTHHGIDYDDDSNSSSM